MACGGRQLLYVVRDSIRFLVMNMYCTAQGVATLLGSGPR